MKEAMPWLLGVAGLIIAFWIYAEMRLKGYQSKLRLLPALVGGGEWVELALVVAISLGGGALGWIGGLAMRSGLESVAR